MLQSARPSSKPTTPLAIAPEGPLSRVTSPMTKPIAAPTSVTAATKATMRPVVPIVYSAASSGAAGHQAWKWCTGECPAPTR